MHLAEAVGFEPTNELPRYRISSAGRYDHFDTLPYFDVEKPLARRAHCHDHFDTLPYRKYLSSFSVVYYSI